MLCRCFTPKRHRQLRIKDLPMVPRWRLERDSNPRPSGRKPSTLPMSHKVSQLYTVLGQNGSGRNGTDEMVWTKWYTDKMALDKMVWTKWHGQNGTDKMVQFYILRSEERRVGK